LRVPGRRDRHGARGGLDDRLGDRARHHAAQAAAAGGAEHDQRRLGLLGRERQRVRHRPARDAPHARAGRIRQQAARLVEDVGDVVAGRLGAGPDVDDRGAGGGVERQVPGERERVARPSRAVEADDEIVEHGLCSRTSGGVVCP
jgi:hypothetical protein